MTVAAAWRGPWRAQHQPVPLASGKILLFDNKGAATGSRVVEFDPANGELSWVFPGVAQEALSSPEAGSCQRLQNGNTLITESEMARALEITPEGQVVWEFVNPHRAGEKQELVATLFEVIRYPVEALPFVENAGSR
jgi:outer membrane protein assembly factor BamB